MVPCPGLDQPLQCVRHPGHPPYPGGRPIRLGFLDGAINPLRGTKARQGDDKVGTAVALTVLFGPVGLQKHGKNSEMSEGTPLTGFVAENAVTILFRNGEKQKISRGFSEFHNRLL